MYTKTLRWGLVGIGGIYTARWEMESGDSDDSSSVYLCYAYNYRNRQGLLGCRPAWLPIAKNACAFEWVDRTIVQGENSSNVYRQTTVPLIICIPHIAESKGSEIMFGRYSSSSAAILLLA